MADGDGSALAGTAAARGRGCRGGVIATAHSLASEAGLAVLADGGNAMDAAVAAAAVLGVAQPMMSGLGGDSFILFRDAGTGKVHAIDGGGPAPRALSPASLKAMGRDALPERGLLSASVPGAVDAMCVAHRQFGSGRFPLGRLLARAIALAADGVPLARSVGRFFAVNAPLLAATATTRAIFCSGDAALAEGDILRQPDLADTLDQIARGGADAFYRGDFARRLAAYSRDVGGAFDADDLAAYRCAVAAPIAVRWRGRTVYSNPPVGQGIVLLEALGILDACARRLADAAHDAAVHRQVEALKLAFADRNRFVGDPRFVADAVPRLLAATHIEKRAAAIDPDKAWAGRADVAARMRDGDTTCFAVADRDGNAVAYITSLSAPFGSGEVVAGTGVLMNNRTGRGFSLDPASPNCLAPGKRTVSTLHAYIVCDDDGWRLAGGTSGGDGQPQWNLQVLEAVFGSGRDVQDAIDAPRWELTPGTDPANLPEPFEVRIDPRLDPTVIDGLRRRGHTISDKPLGMLGAAQAVMRDADGALRGGADRRADGCVLTLD